MRSSLAAMAIALAAATQANAGGEGVWNGACPAGQWLGGLKLRGDERLTVIAPLCVSADRGASGYAWASEPAATEIAQPEPLPEPADETKENVLRASSHDLARFRGSRALLIVKGRRLAPDDRLAAGEARDMLCPRDSFVTGIRTPLEGDLSVGLVCGQPGRRPRTSVGYAGPGQRTDCERASGNPYAGDVADGIYGALESGLVISLGLTCDAATRK